LSDVLFEQEMSKTSIEQLEKGLAAIRVQLTMPRAKADAKEGKLNVAALESGLQELSAVVKQQARAAAVQGSESAMLLQSLLQEQRQLQATVTGLQADVAELKSLNGVVTDLRTTLERSQSELKASMADLSGNAKKQGEALLNQLAATQQKLESVHAEVKDGRSDLAALREQMAGSLGSLTAHVNSAAAYACSAAASSAAGGAALGTLVGTLQKSVNEMQVSVGDVMSRGC
jgi:chromosome segregation ATPase